MSRMLNLILRCLKDTFVISYYKFKGELDFPTSILPRIFFKNCIDFDALFRHQKVILLRRSEYNYDETFNSLGMLREDAIDLNRIPNMSLNLLGTYFKPEYSKFRITKKAAEKWINIEPVFLSEYVEFINLWPDSCNIFIDANNIHDQTIPYAIPKSNKGIHAEIEKYFKKVPILNQTEDGYDVTSRTKVIHDPVKLNYWHVEYSIEDFKGVPFPSKKPSVYQSVLFKKIYVDILIANSSSKVDFNFSVPPKHYRRF